MDAAYTAVIVLAIATLLIGALVFGGSFLVYNLSNRQVKAPGADTPDAADPGDGSTGTPGDRH